MINLDHAATTATAPAVLEAMLPAFALSGNPSSIHGEGRQARKLLEDARRQIAGFLGAQAKEIYFTAGGSESDNWALRGIRSRHAGARHLITSGVEHHAVLHTCDLLEETGTRVTRLPVDACGRIRPDDLAAALDSETALVSLMAANNETGVLQPIHEAAQIAHAAGVPFHTDAVQLYPAQAIDVRAIEADLLSLSAHKFHGPKGIGILYIREGTHLSALIAGGAQERGRRAGTENVPGAVGMAKAMALTEANRAETASAVAALQQRLFTGLKAIEPGLILNGESAARVPGILNVSFPGVESEALLMRLDMAGICASGGSACTAGSLEASHVLLAMGVSREVAKGSIRFSFGADNTPEEMDTTLSALAQILPQLRS